MCDLCRFPPKPSDYAELCGKARTTLSLLEAVPNLRDAPTEAALQAIADLDQHRWATAAEWAHPAYADVVRRVIFLNSHAEHGLRRFLGACLMDMQMRFQHVWSVSLLELDRWLDGKGPMPNHRFPENVHPHLEKLKGVENIASWATLVVSDISAQSLVDAGNLYRFMHRLLPTFTISSPSLAAGLRRLQQGELGLLGDWKRAWMLLMFLRRDQWVKCLFDRACEGTGRHDMLARFYSVRFPETESELPVDSRLDVISQRFFHWTGNRQRIAQQARAWTRQHLDGRPTSVLDALFFGL